MADRVACGVSTGGKQRRLGAALRVAGGFLAWPALLAMAVIVASGCRINRKVVGHAREQILYSGSLSDAKTFNPILVTDGASGAILDRMFEGLVKLNPKTTLPEPDLAKSWQIGDGGREITFHLRHNVKWDDGKPFTARDVLFTLRTIYNPRVPNSFSSILTIDGKQIKAEAPDPYTVKMILPRPFAPLLYSIGFPILPAHILEPALKAKRFTQTWGINTPPAKLIGLGPYRMTQYVQGQFVHFKRNPGYWMRDKSGARLPRLKGQVVTIVPNQNALYLRFLSGQIDVYDPRPEEVADLRQKASSLGITLKKIGIDTGSLFFAFNRNPRHYVHDGVTDPRLKWFTDHRFMLAIAHAIDKQQMINVCFHGLGVPAVADISPENKVFHNPNLKDYNYDPALAAQILDAAGYKMIRPGVRGDPQGHRLEFNLTTNTGVGVRSQMCAIFKQDLANLGIKVDYRPLEFTTLVEKLQNTFDWDCVLIGFSGGGVEPNNSANFLRSSGNLHIWDPSEPKPATPWEAEIDKLLNQGTAEMDPTKRAPYYWKIQKILHDELPIIETVRQEDFQAWKNSLENYDPTVWGLYQPEYIQFRAQ